MRRITTTALTNKAAGTGHRYWRVLVNTDQGDGGRFGCNGLIFASSTAGTNLANSSNVTANSINGGSIAALFDSNDTTFLLLNTTASNTAWIQMDYGSDVDVCESQLRTTNNGFYTGVLGMTGWALQYSDDASSWTTSVEDTSVAWNTTNTWYTVSNC